MNSKLRIPLCWKVYPAVEEAGGSDVEDLVKEAKVEHNSVKELISKIEKLDPDDELFDATYKVIAEQVEHHADEEEQEMFPKVEKLGIDLLALGDEIKERKRELEAEQDTLMGKAKSAVRDMMR